MQFQRDEAVSKVRSLLTLASNPDERRHFRFITTKSDAMPPNNKIEVFVKVQILNIAGCYKRNVALE